MYNLPALASQAFYKAVTRDNILSGFKKYGISPFNSNILMSWISLCLCNRSFFTVCFIKSKYFYFKRLRSTNENRYELPFRLHPEDVKPFPKAVAQKENIVKNSRKKMKQEY